MAEAALFTPICTDLLRAGQAVRFRATGGSMHPTIRDGETVVVRPIDPKAVRRGDVVLYRGRRGLTAHRVMRVIENDCAPDVFMIRGDHGAGLDEHVESAQVLGRVASVERSGLHCDPGSTGALLIARTWHRLARIRGFVVRMTAVMRLVSPRSRRRHRDAG
jgi:signal peptidase I